MGKLTANLSPAALMVFAWSALQNSYFLPFFCLLFFMKYTMVVIHFDIFIEITFLDAFCYRMIENKFRKKILVMMWIWNSTKFLTVQL
jgi:hypothetical protein